ncbi:unnamed protein product [Sphagnum jensenii]|uniref:AsmA domain-containing protein n=1 Tax=Sphagnum jensenii TaxID=128206 RepID=A0ABP0VDP0_9BRYO
MMVIPMVVDVDKYRPQIVSAVDEHINGKVELGKLSLSLWGKVSVDIAGVKVTDSGGHPVVSVNNAFIDIPLLPILTGSPEVTFKMQSPDVAVFKDKAGKMNVMALAKTSASPVASPTAKPADNSETKVPAIVANARLGFELRDATLTYKDETTGLSTQLKNLNFVAKDLSLSHPSEIELWSDLDTTLGKELTVKGPARLSGKLNPTVTAGQLDHFQLTATADLDSLEITMPGTFEKKKGVAANADIALSGSAKEMRIDQFNVKFFNADIKSSGTITGLENPATAAVQYQITSNEIELKPWTELVPMLKEYELGGSTTLSAAVGGQVSKLSYQAKVGVKDLTAKSAKLKEQPVINGNIVVTTDQIESLLFTLKAPGNDLTIKGKVVSFTAPQVTMDVTSSGMDLDRLMVTPEKTAPAKTEPASKAAGDNGALTTKTSGDMDAMLDPLRTNPIALKTNASINVDMKSIQAQVVRIDNLQGKMTFKDLVATLDHFSLKVFDGAVKLTASSQFKPKQPVYHFTADVAGLDLAKAISAEMAAFKNTITGRLNMNASGEGASFNPDLAKANLQMKGSFKVQNAEFTSIDVGKMASSALSESLGKIGGKIPGLAGKQLPAPPSKTMKYDLISSDFGISGGVFSAPNFVAKATPQQGIDLKGLTQVGLKDYGLKLEWEVIDTYNMTHAKDLNVNAGGIQVNHILAQGNNPVQFPVTAGCTALQPCFSYKDVSDVLGKVALSNVGSQGKSQILQKAIGDKLPGGVPPALKDKLKNLFGG